MRAGGALLRRQASIFRVFNAQVALHPACRRGLLYFSWPGDAVHFLKSHAVGIGEHQKHAENAIHAEKAIL